MLCDFAETYHIYDLEQLPLHVVAVLACGLRDDSRIKMKMNGATIPSDILMLAHIIDRLSLLVWQNTENGARGIDSPESLVKMILHPETVNSRKIEGFDTGADFEKARTELLERAMI